jgi:FKBP-type peptidyl-prolyl cis-trans isomerase SlyD
MTIDDKHVVSIHYTLKNDEGETLDSSQGREPLAYLHGAGNLVPGLETALAGKAAGDQLQVTVEPEEAYGPANPDLVQAVPLAAFEGVEEVRPGMQFEAKGPDGRAQRVVVEEVGEQEVVINGNHPLAGQVLHFDVTVEEVREATPEEIAHGHAH